MSNSIKLNYKNLNEFIKNYSKGLKKSSHDTPEEKIFTLTLNDKEYEFLVSLLNEVVPDDANEGVLISDMKNKIQSLKN